MKRYIKSATIIASEEIPEYTQAIKRLAVLLYESPDVVIGKMFADDSKLETFIYTDYGSPRYGNPRSEWLNAGLWKQYPDGKWYKYNEITGGKASPGVNSIDQIANAIRNA